MFCPINCCNCCNCCCCFCIGTFKVQNTFRMTRIDRTAVVAMGIILSIILSLLLLVFVNCEWDSQSLTRVTLPVAWRMLVTQGIINLGMSCPDSSFIFGTRTVYHTGSPSRNRSVTSITTSLFYYSSYILILVLLVDLPEYVIWIHPHRVVLTTLVHPHKNSLHMSKRKRSTSVSASVSASASVSVNNTISQPPCQSLLVSSKKQYILTIMYRWNVLFLGGY